ncbi:MAG: energy transducer TonB [Candidatus Sulfotelmatobacter sp.]
MFEQDSSDYLPLAIRVLTSAMISPQIVLDSYRPGDFERTKANGLADESGKICFSANGKMCGMSRNGLAEFVGAAGRSLEFTDYRKFKGERVARLLIYRIDPGDSWQARVNTLGELQKHDESGFKIKNPTEKPNQIRAVVVEETELRGLAQQPLEIIWPQVLEDNNTTGETSYYVSLDRSGQVREVLPLSVAIERADDSARRQILKWKFKPVLRDGAPVQAESILSFSFNTRAYGPASPLTDEEVRKLATNIIDPVFSEGTVPSGSTFEIRIAVDEEGNIIESMAGDGPHAMYQPCSKAVGKWHFSPIVEEGKPRPYRAKVICRVP